MDYRDSVSRKVKKKPTLKSTGPTRYSGLVGRSGRPELVNDMYQGVWHGTMVSFDRNFRGHRFTDEECKALCNGERIEIHNITNRHGIYAVQGHLEENTIAFLGGVKFVVLDTVPNNPDFHYGMPLHDIGIAQEKYKLNTDVVDLDDDSDLEGILFEDPRDIFERSKDMAVKASEAALADKGDDNKSDNIKVVEIAVEPEPMSIQSDVETDDDKEDWDALYENPDDYMVESDEDYNDDVPDEIGGSEVVKSSDEDSHEDEVPEEATDTYMAALSAYIEQTGKIIPDEVVDARVSITDMDIIVPDAMGDDE